MTPTDAAIAQAFRERLESMYSPLTVREVMKAVEARARELDAEKGGRLPCPFGDACVGRDCNKCGNFTPGRLANPQQHTPPAQAAEAVAIAGKLQEARLRIKALEKALALVPANLACDSFHHSTGDRHGALEQCPVAARYETARAAIAAMRAGE